MKRRRILISAFALSPIRGSEPGVGWNICKRLGQYHDVHVLFGENDHKLQYKAEVDSYVRDFGNPTGITFHPISHPLLSRACQKIHDMGIWIVYYLGYYQWQKKALVEAQKLHRIHNYELVHQLNMIGYREPGFLWQLPIPFVWGPIGGTSNIPWKYFKTFSARGQIDAAFRNIANEIQKRLSVRPRKAARRASKIWVVGDTDHYTVEKIWGCKAEYLLETGVEKTPFTRIREYDGKRQLHIIWSGNHIDRKGFTIAIDAIAEINESMPLRLTVLGDGDQTYRWKKYARNRGIEEKITWMGRLSRKDALTQMSQADLLMFTSLSEGTSHVVMESLSMGMPVICHNTGGMGRAVTPDCGITIERISPEISVKQFAQATMRFLKEPGLLKRLSQGALKRLEYLSWDYKAAYLAKCYDDILTEIEDGMDPA